VKAETTSTGYKSHRQTGSKAGSSSGENLYQSSPNERLFKKSVDKIKKTFFRGVRDNREATIKTLK
jgi:hypothetical protein